MLNLNLKLFEDETPRSDTMIAIVKGLLRRMHIRGEEETDAFKYLADMVNRHEIRKELQKPPRE